MLSLCFLILSATVARACRVALDIDPWFPENKNDDKLANAETNNRVCAYGISKEGKNVSACVNGVHGDGATIEFNNGQNLSKSSPVYLEIQGHDELWLDKITVYPSGENRADWGQHNGEGWCMSTNPNDYTKFDDWRVPAGKCFRTLRLNTSGSVDGLQYSHALKDIPGVQDQLNQAKAAMESFSFLGRWGRRLEEAEEDDDVDGADHVFSDFEALPEDAWVELLPGQERRLLENELLSNRLAALEEGL